MQKIIIALEGIDGAGKSSTIKLLVDRYKPYITVYTRTQKTKLIDKLVSCNFMRKHYMLQVPIYIYLSHINLLKNRLQLKNSKIIIMDRCFLSNICYFYPQSLNNQRLFKFLMHFEPQLFPQKIFVLDVKPYVAYIRDLYKKDLRWLVNTRSVYLNAQYSKNLSKYNIEVINEKVNVVKKVKIISDYIQEVIKNGN